MWLKIKIWTKTAIFALITLYALVFLLQNIGQPPVKLWFWYKTELTISPLLLVFMTLLLGVLATILSRAVLTTIRQIRGAREQGRLQRLEREVQDQKAKAAMLQRKPEA